MSISFKKNNNFEDLQNAINYNLSKLDISDVKKTIFDHFIKIFDSHYLNYINHRKQRDLIILNCFYKKIFEVSEIDNSLKEKYELSDFFIKSKNHLKINNEILPINYNENILSLEKEMEILKTLHLFFKNFFYKIKDFNLEQNIEKKMLKINTLNDERFLERITKNDKIKKNIFDQIGNVKNIQYININYIFYNNLHKELNLYGVNL